MNSKELQVYLGLSEEEFGYLVMNSGGGALQAYSGLDAVSDNLEQLLSRYNRPPKTSDDDPVHDALEARSVAAFARLEALIKAHEEFRRARAEGSYGAPVGRRRRQGRGGRNPAYDGPDGIFADYQGPEKN